MKILFTKQFEKEIRKIKDKNLARKVEEAILAVKESNSISEIKNLKKLVGFQHAYRIRIGDYRIGLFESKTHIEFSRFLHRKEIYRYFP